MKYTFSIKPHPTNSAIWVQLSAGESRSDKVELKGNNTALEFGEKPKALIIERKVSLLKRLTSSFHCKYLKAKGEDGSILYFPIFRNLAAGETTVSEGSAKLPWEDKSEERKKSLQKKYELWKKADLKTSGIKEMIKDTPLETVIVTPSQKVVTGILTYLKILLKVLLSQISKNCNKLSIKDNASMPASVNGKTFFDLPVNLWFGPCKILTLVKHLVLGVIHKIIRRLNNFCRKWTAVDHIKRVFLFTTKKAKYISENWQQDSFFAKQFLTGCNPVMIEKCTAIPYNIILVLKKTNALIEEDFMNGDIYMVDYKLLKDVEEAVHHSEQQYVAAPIVILKQTEEGLMPIAIQLKQNPGDQVFTPEDGKAWLLAKIWVRNSEFYVHELVSHLLRTHLMGEVFFFTLYSFLYKNHPILKLFMATGRYTLPINVTARDKLINKTGFFMTYTALSETGMNKVLEDAYRETTYKHLCLPDNLKLRGVEDLKGYHYRDDGMEIWKAIEEFVKAVIYNHYVSDTELYKDRELQKFFWNVCVDGFQNKIQDLPSEVKTRDEAVKYLTMVMFTCSAQHAAVNNGQFDSYAWMPNGPITMRQPPPEKKTEVTEKYIMNTLPDINTTLEAMAVAAFLSQVSTDFVPLGQYSQEISNEPHFEEPIKRFQDSLKKIGEKIDKRASEEFHYNYLHPAHMENSIAI